MKAPTHKWRHGLCLAIFLFSLLGSMQNALAQEIPNGDGDLLWERPLNGRTVNDAKFHPINGNIIAAVNHEIWEIDPKDGHTIRVFEGGGTSSGSDKDQFKAIYITSDGTTVITGDGSGIDGLILWDYNTGKIKRIFSTEKPDSYSDNLGIFPDNNRIVFYSVRQVGQNYLKKLNIYSIESNDLIKEIDMGKKNIERLSLSKDGKYLALGISEKNFDNWTFTMELWDAETLTKIKDFGELKVNSFKDIQISEDNQYVGVIGEGGWKLYLFNNTTNSLLKLFDKTFAFAFTKDCNKMLFYTDYGPQNAEINVIKLSGIDTLFQYSKPGSCLRINSNNEIFSVGFDTTIGAKMQYFSNRWYEVGIAIAKEGKIAIINTNYVNNSLQITTEGIEIINTLMITDTLGKKIYIQNEIPVINNQITIPLFLPSGNYLLKLMTNGKEYTSKFIVER